jgi:hypothetical protein
MWLSADRHVTFEASGHPTAGSARTVLRDNTPPCFGGRSHENWQYEIVKWSQQKEDIPDYLNDIARFPDRRKYRRFLVSCPVHVKFHCEHSLYELQAVTRNVSIDGFLIETASPIPQHCSVDFVMTLQGGLVILPLQVAGRGKVMRIEPHGPSAGFAIAVKCKRTITQVQHHLPGLAE